MGTYSYIKGVLLATWTGFSHLFKPRMTLRYPEQKMDLEGPGYQYDPKTGTGKPGFKGRHILSFDNCTGCSLCAIACDGVAVAIEMQHVVKGKPKNKKDIFPAVDYGRCVFCALCVDPDTDVMTNPGIRPMREIYVGDRVLTHTGQYKPVTKTWKFEYTGPLYKVKVMGKARPLVCTADHRILAVRRPISTRHDRRLLRATQPLQMTLPSELKRGDYVVTPIPRRVVDQDEFKVEYTGISGKHEIKLRTEPDLFRLIGYYLSEGSTYEPGRQVYFSFGSHEHDLVRDASNLLRKHFAKEPKVDILRHHVANLRIGSTLAMIFFSQFGRGAQNKGIPDWVFCADRDKQVQLIKGIWLGDGCVVNQPRQKYLNITTTSKLLASQVQTVLSRIGVVSTLNIETSENKLPAFRVNIFGKWAIELTKMMGVPFDYKPAKRADKFHLTSDYLYSPIEAIKAESVSRREVMDITVEGDHTFVGEGIVQHNCVDACPFDALYMTNDYELSAYDKMALKYTPDMLAVPPKTEGVTFKVKIDPEKGTATHG
jgi:formate hydrogenlyase subunit 6/NADH:ubiquinone oxidoreductase subunit I